MRVRVACGAALVAASIFGVSGCVMPVRVGPGLEGTVVDRTTGAGVEGAIVVVSYDGRYGDKLPDREHLGHAEVTTGPDGSFRLPRYVRGGLSVWPMFQVETRVATVLHPGHRCAVPIHVEGDDPVRIELTPALDTADQRDSCRPVASRRGEAEAYRTAWRALFQADSPARDREQERELSRTLEARAALGFGHNCTGPVTDLALAPGGERAAFVVAGRGSPEVQLVDLGAKSAGAPRSVGSAADAPPRRLAWTGAGELVLWQPASVTDRAISPSVFSGGSSRVIWSAAPALPAALDRGAAPLEPLDPADLSDEADTLWLGRSFALERTLDPDTGLSRDRLRVTRQDGTAASVELPGEACGGARFGRPQYRIAAPGRVGLDLRFVGGGCHAVAIDLETGAWSRLDRINTAASCRDQRSVPPAQLGTALRGWTRDLHAALEAAGADPGAAYALRIDRRGQTLVLAKTPAGEPLSVPFQRFPIATPLRRIDVTNVSPAVPGSRGFPAAAPPAAMEPL
jgi:hypothetical protein